MTDKTVNDMSSHLSATLLTSMSSAGRHTPIQICRHKLEAEHLKMFTVVCTVPYLA